MVIALASRSKFAQEGPVLNRQASQWAFGSQGFESLPRRHFKDVRPIRYSHGSDTIKWQYSGQMFHKRVKQTETKSLMNLPKTCVKFARGHTLSSLHLLIIVPSLDNRTRFLQCLNAP